MESNGTDDYRHSMSMARIREAIVAGASGAELATIPMPEFARGALVLAHETDMFEGLASEDKDPRKSMHASAEYPLPELAPDEATSR